MSVAGANADAGGTDSLPLVRAGVEDVTTAAGAADGGTADLDAGNRVAAGVTTDAGSAVFAAGAGTTGADSAVLVLAARRAGSSSSVSSDRTAVFACVRSPLPGYSRTSHA